MPHYLEYELNCTFQILCSYSSLAAVLLPEHFQLHQPSHHSCYAIMCSASSPTYSNGKPEEIGFTGKIKNSDGSTHRCQITCAHAEGEERSESEPRQHIIQLFVSILSIILYDSGRCIIIVCAVWMFGGRFCSLLTTSSSHGF